MTQKFSQSHFRIQTRSQRRSEGPRPRRLTKALQPSSQCPMGAYQSHRDPDTLKLKVGVRAHEALDKVLTEPVSLLREDPTLNPPAMLTCRSRTGQEHDLEGYPQQVRSE